MQYETYPPPPSLYIIIRGEYFSNSLSLCHVCVSQICYWGQLKPK